ncbi:MAG TPA: formate dehydrogenase accessory protein FdhE [Gemmatimonadaceae bacterium]|nr:formate dehydrogenase accessory protein FdhE [Gemmatimonadaceae bacterium]
MTYAAHHATATSAATSSPSLSSTIRQTVAEQLAPVARLSAELTGAWRLAVDLARARTRLAGGLVAFDPLDVLGAAGDLLVPFVRATSALERAGLATIEEEVQARERRFDLLPLVVSWLSGEPEPRDRGRAAARRAASLVASSVLRTASARLREFPDGEPTVAALLVSWQRAHCPCCGGSPDFAVRDGEARSLLCSRCDTSWPTTAHGCLGCGAREAPTIARITSHALGYQLTICNSCGRYIKEPLSGCVAEPLIERLMTAELDAAAEARGLRL